MDAHITDNISPMCQLIIELIRQATLGKASLFIGQARIHIIAGQQDVLPHEFGACGPRLNLGFEQVACLGALQLATLSVERRRGFERWRGKSFH